MTAHAHPGLVAVTAGPPDEAGRLEFGSGLLISGRLVLTARHTVMAEDGPRPDVRVQLVTGPRGAIEVRSPVGGHVVWSGTQGTDAALVELDVDASWRVPARFLPPLRWGELVTTAVGTGMAVGLPAGAMAATGERLESVTVRGTIDPGTYTNSDRLAMDVSAGWPGSWKSWSGFSGAALFDSPRRHVMGLVAWSDAPFEGRRVTAVPTRRLLADPGFRAVLAEHGLDAPALEPVEFADMFAVTQPLSSIGDLLRADLGVAEFHGRAAELDTLTDWRDGDHDQGGHDLGVLLMTGQGGAGKTRLALEFVARSKAAGWLAGLVDGAVGPMALAGIAESTRPVLAVFDYAAAASGELAQLIDAVLRAGPLQPIRILLLAREAGPWWQEEFLGQVRQSVGAGAEVMELAGLLPESGRDRGSDADLEFRAAARTLAPRLAPFLERSPAELAAIAEQVELPAAPSADLTHALTLHLLALGAVLQACEPLAAPSAAPEDVLLHHEKKYRNKLADRQQVGWHTVRDRAVLAATLMGARANDAVGAQQRAGLLVADATASSMSLDDQRKMSRWIAGVYPPPIPSGGAVEFFGTVQPDRLGEFMAARLLLAEVSPDPDGAGSDLLTALARGADEIAAPRALLVLSRACEHEPRMAAVIERLIMASAELTAPAADNRLIPLAAVALAVATYAENPAPLRSAVVTLGMLNRPALLSVMELVSASMPTFSLRMLDSNAALAGEQAVVFRALADRNRDAYLPNLAIALSNHAVRLSEMGWQTEALTYTGEAVGCLRELVDLDRDGYLQNLATALSNYSVQMAATGGRIKASAWSREAVDIYRELAAADRTAHLPKLAIALSNLSVQLSEAGQLTEGLPLSQETVELRRELAELDRDTYLPDLATALTNHAVQLGQVGRPTVALALSREAADLRRELVGRNRDAHLPNLAAALSNYAVQLAAVGSRAEAATVSLEALDCSRELITVNRDAYLPNLGIALNNYAFQLSEMGRWTEALTTCREAVDTYRELADLNRDAHLPNLAVALNNYATRLNSVGLRLRALTFSQEAVDTYRELVELNRDAYLPVLAVALSNNSVMLSELGQWRQALKHSREAANCLRELVGVNRDAYLSQLATALSNHAMQLSESGQNAEALPISREAVAHYRELAARNRDAFLPALTTAMSNHASQLSATGHRAEALSLSQEAVERLRELVDLNRDAYLPNFATALSNYSVHLSEMDRWPEALSLSREAVDDYRELADLNRQAHLPGLATALSNESVQLAEAGRRAEALAVSQEAVELRRELAGRNRDVYLPDLTVALIGHAKRLAEVGRNGDSALAAREAETLKSELGSRTE